MRATTHSTRGSHLVVGEGREWWSSPQSGPDAGIDRLGNRFRSHGRHDEEEKVDKHFSSSRNQVTKRGRKGLELSLHSVSE